MKAAEVLSSAADVDMASIDRIVTKTHLARLNLRAPATPECVEDLEAQAGVQFPDDYRCFLVTAANGGHNPCRLVSLSRWHDSYWIDEPRPAMISQNCLLTPGIDEHGKGWLDSLNVPDWESRWDRDEWSPMFGTVAIAEIGCGLFYSLIITGLHRGRIFVWGDHALNPPYFVPQRNFSDWIEFHLDQALAGKPVHFLNGRVT